MLCESLSASNVCWLFLHALEMNLGPTEWCLMAVSFDAAQSMKPQSWCQDESRQAAITHYFCPEKVLWFFNVISQLQGQINLLLVIVLKSESITIEVIALRGDERYVSVPQTSWKWSKSIPEGTHPCFDTTAVPTPRYPRTDCCVSYQECGGAHVLLPVHGTLWIHAGTPSICRDIITDLLTSDIKINC